MSIIYAIRNTVNDRVYIGKTSLSIDERKKQHFRNLQIGKHICKMLQFDFSNIGEDKFYIEVVETVSEENVLEIEAYWIIQMYLKNRHYNQSIPFNKYKKAKDILNTDGIWSPT